ncbi:uncharacterized protein PV07_01148 [Cladophialophora immunda]|uniref:Uncharacterized protein n=1 Tax=Cladophialophora immunda TaxID=569365 RepID=A0A0D2DF84_9EURO|nr:uncharacterized protein PV07_01148 [Cladophialophora immunda]KIW34369.1 hypothetical protein PV07_01148 [Cladophialophora immunda]
MSDEEYADLDNEQQLDLYEYWDTEEQAKKGGVKTFEVKEEGGLIFDSGKSDYAVTVERVLGVDGSGEAMAEDGKTHTAQMTVLILKIVVAAKPGCRIRSVEATLRLDNPKGGSQPNPVVQAWAPFRKLQLTNPTAAKIKQTSNTTVGAQATYQGAGFHTDHSRGYEIDFERTYYDFAYSTPCMDPTSHKRAGVTWYMEQNDLQNSSVLLETFAAILFTRASDGPYLVRFDIDVRGGTLYDFSNKLKRAFGLGPGHTKPFLVHPSPNPKVRGGEGNDFLLGIQNLKDDLGKLRAEHDSTGLKIVRKSGQGGSAEEEPTQPGSDNAENEAEGEDTRVNFAEDDGQEEGEGEGGEFNPWADEA